MEPNYAYIDLKPTFLGPLVSKYLDKYSEPSQTPKNGFHREAAPVGYIQKKTIPVIKTGLEYLANDSIT